MQRRGQLRYIKRGIPSGSLPTESGYQAMLDYAAANNYTLPDATMQEADNKFYHDKRIFGVFQECDVFWKTNTAGYTPNAGENNFYDLNWIDPTKHNLQQVDVLDFVSGSGYEKPSHQSGYLKTNFTPSTDAVKMQPGDASVFFKLNNFPLSDTGVSRRIAGARVASGGNEEINLGNYSDGIMLTRFLGRENVGQSAELTIDQTNINSHFHIINTVGSSQKIFFNNDLVIDRSNPTSDSLPSVELYLLGLNLNGTANNDGTGGLEYFGIGSDLLDKQKEIYQVNNNPTESYTPDDIIVELGQSNMEGRDGDIANPEYPFTSANGFFYNGTSQELISTLRGGAQEGSHANYFCEKYFELSGRKAVMIEASAGGTGLTSTSKPDPDNWSSTGANRGEAETLISSALTFYDRTTPKAALWNQGERDALTMDSDAGYTKAIVKSAMQDVIDWWFGLYPNSVFIISELGQPDSGDTTGFSDMRDIQNEIAAENTKVYIGFTGAKNFPAEGKMDDEYHYTYVGNKDMGEALATTLNSLL